jgi:hypothetical protein
MLVRGNTLSHVAYPRKPHPLVQWSNSWSSRTTQSVLRGYWIVGSEQLQPKLEMDGHFELGRLTLLRSIYFATPSQVDALAANRYGFKDSATNMHQYVTAQYSESDQISGFPFPAHITISTECALFPGRGVVHLVPHQREWSWLEGGISAPRLNRKFAVERVRLPVWIWPPGFIANTLFWAVSFWFATRGVFSILRRLRWRKGLCGQCAYPMQQTGTGACPECGTPPRY